jgi:hypothetical protein
MGHPSDSLAIEKRLKEISETISSLQAEADELNVALRVFEKYFQQGPSKKRNAATFDASAKMGPPRPSGIPTNFEMTEMVIKSAEKEGKNGLTASEIVEQIGKRYWPGIVGAQILPMIYKFAKEGRLRKTPNGKFKSVRNNEGSHSDE